MQLKKDKLLFAALILAPVFFTVLFSWYYSSGVVKSIPTAVLDFDNSSLSRMIINYFENNEKYDVKYYAKDEIELKNLIEQGNARMALVFPPDFSRKIKKGEDTRVLVICNETNLIVGNNALTRASEILQSLGVGILIKKIESLGYPPEYSDNLAMPLGFATRVLGNPAYNYSYFLIPGLIGVVFLEISILNMARTVAVDALKEENVKELLGIYITRMFLYLILLLLVFIICIFAVNKFFKIPIRGKMTDVIALAIPFITSCINIGAFLGIVTKNPLFSVQVTAYLSMPTFLASGFTWPYHMMPEPIKKFATFWPLYSFIIPLRNIMLLGSSGEEILLAVKQLGLISVFGFLLNIFMILLRSGFSEKAGIAGGE
ncbi:Inner membrane transport permease YbhS [Fervidicola ferrireducens]|uniref:Inner membrane transport permease YbhS n=2 Tax=Fervidicola ferrireducens TaxID=520764 RepID=A0A140L8S6_9FIRM|nr:Inner membrane transport permease YbhS [Fervidicola ferrireducens]